MLRNPAGRELHGLLVYCCPLCTVRGIAQSEFLVNKLFPEVILPISQGPVQNLSQSGWKQLDAAQM